jgi:hypothetical protein
MSPDPAALRFQRDGYVLLRSEQNACSWPISEVHERPLLRNTRGARLPASRIVTSYLVLSSENWVLRSPSEASHPPPMYVACGPSKVSHFPVANTSGRTLP